MKPLNGAYMMARDGLAPLSEIVKKCTAYEWQVLPVKRLTEEHLDPEMEIPVLSDAIVGVELNISALNEAFSLPEIRAVPATAQALLKLVAHIRTLILMQQRALLLNPVDLKDPGRVLLHHAVVNLLAQIVASVEDLRRKIDQPSPRQVRLVWHPMPIAELGVLLQWRDARATKLQRARLGPDEAQGRTRSRTLELLAAGGALGVLVGWLLPSGGSD